jgi:hypothetical protein
MVVRVYPMRPLRSIGFEARLTLFKKRSYMLRQICQKFNVGWLRIRAGDLVGRRDLRGLRIHDLLPIRGFDYPLARRLVTATSVICLHVCCAAGTGSEGPCSHKFVNDAIYVLLTRAKKFFLTNGVVLGLRRWGRH